MPGTADEIAIPSLLRASRGTYLHAISHALVEAGCPLLPRGGVLVLSALANRDLQPDIVIGQVARGGRQQELLGELGSLGLIRPVAGAWEATDLGRRAGAAIESAIADIDAQLTEQLGVDGVMALRRGLVALCDIRDAHESRG
jgi:hypothetical protein